MTMHGSQKYDMLQWNSKIEDKWLDERRKNMFIESDSKEKFERLKCEWITTP